MIRIKALGHRELRQVLALLRDHAVNPSEAASLQRLNQLYVPVHKISQWLPPAWQFVPAIFVAASTRQVLGLISLKKDGHQAQRWLIEHVILDPDVPAYDVGQQLLQFVINRYGANGVQTFMACVDTYQDQALALLKAAGFRHCTRVQLWQHTQPADLLKKSPQYKHLREATTRDAEALSQLFNDTLAIEARTSLARPAGDFRKPVTVVPSAPCRPRIARRWLSEDTVRNCLTGSVSIFSEDFSHFYLEILCHPGWPDNFDALLQTGVHQAQQSAQKPILQVATFDFWKDSQAQLEALGFERVHTSEVVVKDYWIPLQDRDKLRSPLLLFTGNTSPAVNIRS
ncbi:MAG: N-acetyltransferase family protein [Candidatus Melainabacteria bacterium]